MLFEREQRPLDGADTGRRDIAVFDRQFLGVFGDVLQHRAKVLVIEQQLAIGIGDLKGEGEHALLNLVEVQQSSQQERAHLGDGCPHWMAFFAVDVPERDRAGGERAALLTQ